MTKKYEDKEREVVLLRKALTESGAEVIETLRYQIKENLDQIKDVRYSCTFVCLSRNLPLQNIAFGALTIGWAIGRASGL